MWRGVVTELEEHGQIGDAFPLACHQHPDTIVHISQPGQIPLYAPDGKKSIDDTLHAY